jgi:hypothetical protein
VRGSVTPPPPIILPTKRFLEKEAAVPVHNRAVCVCGFGRALAESGDRSADRLSYCLVPFLNIELLAIEIDDE